MKEIFDDTKAVIKNGYLKDRQYNGENKQNKKTNNGPQYTTQNRNDRAILS